MNALTRLLDACRTRWAAYREPTNARHRRAKPTSVGVAETQVIPRVLDPNPPSKHVGRAKVSSDQELTTRWIHWLPTNAVPMWRWRGRS